MSRSFRKTPIGGNTKARSEKSDKAMANRKLRSKVNNIARTHDIPDVVFHEKREVSDVWCFSKDGKRWFDKDRFPAIIRK